MKNFGIPDDTVTIAQQGFLTGDITGLAVFGLGGDGYIRHHVTLTFAELSKNDDVTLDAVNVRSMTEAVSVKLAQGVSYSVATMKRLGLTIAFTYFFAPGKGAETMAKYGLVPGGTSFTYAPGTAGRQLFAITPGPDKGIAYAHHIARTIR